MMDDNSLIINLEDPRLPAEVDSGILMEMLEAYREYIKPEEPIIVVLDEAQNVNGWERFARYLVESKGVKCIITGSSAKLLSQEYATSLTGRHIDVEVFPLSFMEFLEFRNIKIRTEVDMVNLKFDIINMFNDYMECGGFPEPILSGNMNTRLELLRNYFNDIIIKDVAKRYRIRNIPQLEQIAKELLSNISETVSLRKISRHYNIGLGTVERFFRYLTESYLFIPINRFSFSTGAQNTALRKVYCIDTGIYRANWFRFSNQTGKLMENIVAIELLRRIGYRQNSGIYYWKDYEQHEVDFVVRIDGKIEELIQVTYSSSFQEIKKREVDNIIRACYNLKCNNLTVVTWNYEDTRMFQQDTINFVPLWRFLLEHTAITGT